MPQSKSQLPLKPIVFDVLLILDDAERHGYGIAKELQQRGSRVLPGNLYRRLSWMIDRGLIEKSPRPRAADDDERRRYFRITELGREVATAEAERLQERVARARAQHLLPGSRAR